MLVFAETKSTPQRSAQSDSWNHLAAIEKRFPRLAGELCQHWKSASIDQYIDSLLLDDRGDRMGFPIDVLDELMFLAGVRWHHTHLCGTVIEASSAELLSFSDSQSPQQFKDPRTWVLI